MSPHISGTVPGWIFRRIPSHLQTKPALLNLTNILKAGICGDLGHMGVLCIYQNSNEWILKTCAFPCIYVFISQEAKLYVKEEP